MKRDYIGYFIAFISIIIGGYFSWYYHNKSLQFRQPTFATDLSPQTIYDAKKEVRLPLKVTREDGTSLEKSVHSANHVFWNAGNLPITSQEILTPIRVRALDPEVEILSVTVTRPSRKVVDCNVMRDGKNSFILNFRILEQDDGCLIKLIYSGPQHSSYIVEGEMVGVRKIEVKNETLIDLIQRDNTPRSLFKKTLSITVLFYPWTIALAYLNVIWFLTTSRRLRFWVVLLMLSTLSTWMMLRHYDKQPYVIDSKITSPAPNWPTLADQ